jgi:hypothetical protein
VTFRQDVCWASFRGIEAKVEATGLYGAVVSSLSFWNWCEVEVGAIWAIKWEQWVQTSEPGSGVV